MVRRGTSIGFFGRFGRSENLRRLDAALREAGLHPLQIPEGVKLAAVSVIGGERTEEPSPTAYPPAGELMALCVLGADQFARENTQGRLSAATQRLEAALEQGESEDAKLILLMLHAGLIHPELVSRYDIRAETDDPD
ncbi:hypothetical protein [Chelativorans sp. YIM 93263]|uniref:hypothetical protein n=1 Tax=Chelativorans sp. YIM 93263 TaxID=2906648 RepID=UPI0023797DAB|nr:hypothetical protein [Chelativorans sp. YIM 93263]